MIEEATNNNYMVIEPTSRESFDDLITNLVQNTKNYTNNHLFINIANLNGITEKSLLKFDSIASKFKDEHKTFVIICKGIDIEKLPETINITPTLQEAEDILEMENIERDLGF